MIHQARRLAPTPAALLVLVLIVVSLLSSCGGESTPQIVVVTATFTPGPIVQVVTATFTAVPEGATPVPEATAEIPPTVAPVIAPTVTLAARQPTQAPSSSAAPVTDVPTEPATAAPTTAPTEALAATPVPTEAPAPSLSSYFVVYTSYEGPDLYNYGLWGMNGDGSDKFKIEGAGQASEPGFSPDGNQFVFYHWVDGLHIWNLKRETSLHVVQNGEAGFPTWSANGQKLAYFVVTESKIYTVNVDGSDNRPLTAGMRPNWALNGGFIAYDSCEANKCGIFRINPDGGGRRQLTMDSGGGAAVSPNGKKIAYWSRADGDFEVYVVNVDGSGARQLTRNGGNDALPAWAPDGKYIYYLSDQNGKAWAIMVMNADGSNARKITSVGVGNDPYRGWQYQRIAVTWNE